MLTPQSAYYLMELIEAPAYHTYDEHRKTYEADLKVQLAPQVAINYDQDGDLYMFEESQFIPTSKRCQLFSNLKLDKPSTGPIRYLSSRRSILRDWLTVADTRSTRNFG